MVSGITTISAGLRSHNWSTTCGTEDVQNEESTLLRVGGHTIE
jgi:hypothetical protein